MSCVEQCNSSALQMAPPLVVTSPRWLFPAVALGVYVLGVALGMATGHWETSLTYNDYMQLIPHINSLGF